jgi:hypothetical protein
LPRALAGISVGMAMAAAVVFKKFRRFVLAFIFWDITRLKRLIGLQG